LVKLYAFLLKVRIVPLLCTTLYCCQELKADTGFKYQLMISSKNIKICISCFLLLVIIFSCKKDSAPPPIINSGNTVLSGTWEIRHVDFSQIIGPPDYSPGNGYQFTFTQSNYLYRSKGKVVDSGYYSIKIISADTSQLVLNGDDQNPKNLFSIKKDTLILYRGTIGADGDIETYVKL
jgi:hypothetical protein